MDKYHFIRLMMKGIRFFMLLIQCLHLNKHTIAVNSDSISGVVLIYWIPSFGRRLIRFDTFLNIVEFIIATIGTSNEKSLSMAQ